MALFFKIGKFQLWQKSIFGEIFSIICFSFPTVSLFGQCVIIQSLRATANLMSSPDIKNIYKKIYNQQLFLILLVRHNYQYSPRQNLNNQWSSHKIFASSTIRITDNLSPLQVGGLKSMASSAHSAAASATSRSSEINLLETLSSNWL